MKYQYWRDKNRVWCWHLTGGDGVVAHGEGYADESDVLRAIDLPRWDGSWVVVDAAVVSVRTDGSRGRRTSYTTVRFVPLDGRTVGTTVKYSPEIGATTVQVRYNLRNPKEVILDSNIITYVGAMTDLIGAGFFLWLAYRASLHDGQKHFM